MTETHNLTHLSIGREGVVAAVCHYSNCTVATERVFVDDSSILIDGEPSDVDGLIAWWRQGGNAKMIVTRNPISLGCIRPIEFVSVKGD